MQNIKEFNEVKKDDIAITYSDERVIVFDKGIASDMCKKYKNKISGCGLNDFIETKCDKMEAIVTIDNDDKDSVIIYVYGFDGAYVEKYSKEEITKAVISDMKQSNREDCIN